MPLWRRCSLVPLADDKKRMEFRAIAQKRGMTEDQVLRPFLERSNPSFVIKSLIQYGPCLQSIKYIASLGQAANGMMCKLDGGSSGTLV